MKALTLFPAMMWVAVSAIAQQNDPVRALAAELKDHVPQQWQVHVRWREGQLFASITPWPYQEAFDLWYDKSRLAEILTNLCPKPSNSIWALIKPDEDIVLEPTVGGKSGVVAAVSCRRVASDPS